MGATMGNPASGSTAAAAAAAAAANAANNALTVAVAGDSSLIHEYLGDVDDEYHDQFDRYPPSSPEETMDGSMDNDDGDEEVGYEDEHDEHSLNSPFDDGGRSVVLSDDDGSMEEGL